MTDLPIPVTDAPLPFTPLSLRPVWTDSPGEALPDAPSFDIKPMTERDYEQVGYELFRHGLVPPSNDTFRARMIDECFTIYGDEKGEEIASLIDSYWTAEDAYRDQMAEWYEIDRQRLADEAGGAPKRKSSPLPDRQMGVRDRNKAFLYTQEINAKSQSIRDMMVEIQSADAIQKAGIARLSVLGWSGLKTEFVRVNGIIPEATYTALRLEIGKKAIAELEEACVTMGGVTAVDRGNSGSPLAIVPTEEPSPEPSGATASAGSSTSAESTPLSTSSSTPIPDLGSDPGTATSSTSTLPSTGESASTVDTPAEPLPTLQPG